MVSSESSLVHFADDVVTPPPADIQVEVPPPDAPACVPEMLLPPTVAPENKSEIEAGLDAITKVFVRPTVENDPEEPWHRL